MCINVQIIKENEIKKKTFKKHLFFIHLKWRTSSDTSLFAYFAT